MTDRKWVRIRSWHAVDEAHQSGDVLTACGRWTRVSPRDPDRVSQTLPAGRSCESCLRITARQDDVPDEEES